MTGGTLETGLVRVPKSVTILNERFLRQNPFATGPTFFRKVGLMTMKAIGKLILDVDELRVDEWLVARVTCEVFPMVRVTRGRGIHLVEDKLLTFETPGDFGDMNVVREAVRFVFVKAVVIL